MNLKRPGSCHRLRAAIITAGLFFLLAGAARAQADDYFDLQPEQLLSARVISASRKEERIFTAPAAVYVISGEDIRRSGVTTIPEALRLAPGVQVARVDGNSWAISIRGFNNALANKLLVMIDGQTVYNPLFAGVYWEAQDRLLADIDRIEVIRGPGGAIWGANAVNGVINIITKHAAETQNDFVSAAYGNYEQGLFAARHGGTFGTDGFYRLYAKSFNRDNFSAPGGGDAYDDWAGYHGGFRMDKGNYFTLQGDAYHIETHQFTNVLRLTAPLSVIQPETLQYQGANILGRWKKTYQEGGLLTIQSYLDFSRRDEEPLLNDKRITFDFDTQYNLAQKGRHEILVGAGYRFTDNREEGTERVFLTPSGRNDHLFSAFIQDEITLVPEHWYLTLGSKFEHNDYSGFEIQPNVRLQWYPDETQTVWAAVSKAVRTPTPLEQDVNFRIDVLPGPLAVMLVENKDFESEELVAYEIGYRKQFTPALSMDIAAFYNTYDNLAVLDILAPAPPVVPVIFDNQMEGETYGFEAVADWSVNDSLSLAAGYSFLDIFLHADSGDVDPEGAEDLAPHHQAKLHASWNINEDWALDTIILYSDQLSGNDVDDYVRLNLNLGWRMTENLRFNLVGQNLIDEHREFEEATNVNAADTGTSIYGKLTWEF